MERRNLIDRIRLSEFFALICTTIMLLALFLLSSVGQYHSDSPRPVTAGFPGNAPIELRSPGKVDEDFIEEAEKLPIPPEADAPSVE